MNKKLSKFVDIRGEFTNLNTVHNKLLCVTERMATDWACVIQNNAGSKVEISIDFPIINAYKIR